VSAAPLRAASRTGRLGDPALPRPGLAENSRLGGGGYPKGAREARISERKKKFEQNKKSFRFARKPASIWRSRSFDPPVLPAGQLSIKNVQKKLQLDVDKHVPYPLNLALLFINPLTKKHTRDGFPGLFARNTWIENYVGSGLNATDH
jgi:hypothetical protein